jgi:hypothetical protein
MHTSLAMMWLSSPALTVPLLLLLPLLAPLPSFPAAAAAAAAAAGAAAGPRALPPVHERLVPYVKVSPTNKTSQDDDESIKARARANGKPLRVSNRCLETIHPGISTQTGVGPEQHGFELAPGASRTLMVEAHWQGRVWGRTNCSFNADGTGASNRGGYDGSGKACLTGDCNGLLDCRVSVGESSPVFFFFPFKDMPKESGGDYLRLSHPGVAFCFIFVRGLNKKYLACFGVLVTFFFFFLFL